MEELTTTDAIKREILEEARRKAERVLKDADEEAARAKRSCAETADRVAREIRASGIARVARVRKETSARVPLEKTRMKTAFVDASLRHAVGEFLSRQGEDRIAALCGALLARGAGSLAGKDILLKRKGLSPERAAEIVGFRLPGARMSGQSEDGSLPAAGLVADAADGSVVVRATLDLVEEALLDGSRGELARALCAEALDLGTLSHEAALST
jgi:V/A-type H+-transporting ATPase subunit E